MEITVFIPVFVKNQHQATPHKSEPGAVVTREGLWLTRGCATLIRRYRSSAFVPTQLRVGQFQGKCPTNFSLS